MLLIQVLQRDKNYSFKTKKIKREEKCNEERWAMKEDYTDFKYGVQIVNNST